MAGHFVLWRLATVDKKYIESLGAVLSGTVHQAGGNAGNGVFPGWTIASRNLLSSIRNGTAGAMANRNGLPPHRYLNFKSFQPSVAQEKYLRTAQWVSDLARPTPAGFGLTALYATAAEEWRWSRKASALIEQVKVGAVSVEVYYLNRKEIT